MSIYLDPDDVALAPGFGPGLLVTEGAPVGDAVQRLLYPSPGDAAGGHIDDLSRLADAERQEINFDGLPFRQSADPRVLMNPYAIDPRMDDAAPPEDVTSFLQRTGDPAAMRARDATSVALFGGASEAATPGAQCQCRCFASLPLMMFARHLFRPANMAKIADALVRASVVAPPPAGPGGLPVLPGNEEPCACSMLGPTAVRRIALFLPDVGGMRTRDAALPTLADALARYNEAIVTHLESLRTGRFREHFDASRLQAMREGVLPAMMDYQPLEPRAGRRFMRANGFARVEIADGDTRISRDRRRIAQSTLDELAHLMDPADAALLRASLDA